jgi:hypothetical protein
MLNHRPTIDAILAAAREAGIEGMDAVERPFRGFPMADNDGVRDYILLAPDFGEHSPWTVQIDGRQGAPEPGVLPCAMQVAEIGDGVLVARLVALFHHTDAFRWIALGPFQECPSPSYDMSVWEDWILTVEEAIVAIPGRLESDAMAMAEKQFKRANMRLQAEHPDLSFEWRDDSDNPVQPSHRVWLRDADGLEIYSATCEDAMSALDTVTAWTWRNLIIHPYDCETEA